MFSTRPIRGLAAVAATTALFVSAAPVASAGDGEIETAGSCSARSDWKLKVGPDDGRLDVEFEVDSNVVGQRWNVVLRDNGVVVFRGARTTLAPSGSFSLERRIANRAGQDRIVARATNPGTGETCTGRLTFPG